MGVIQTAQAAETGIELCREGCWDEGLFCLSHIPDVEALEPSLRGRIYAYQGFGAAYRQNKIREGLALCEKAVKVEFFNPILYYYLARTQILAGKKRAALRTIENGLRMDRNNKSLMQLRKWFGYRRPNVFRFLPRENPLNATLGRLRHRMLGPLLVVPKGEIPQEKPKTAKRAVSA